MLSIPSKLHSKPKCWLWRLFSSQQAVSVCLPGGCTSYLHGQPDLGRYGGSRLRLLLNFDFIPAGGCGQDRASCVQQQCAGEALDQPLQHKTQSAQSEDRQHEQEHQGTGSLFLPAERLISHSPPCLPKSVLQRPSHWMPPPVPMS